MLNTTQDAFRAMLRADPSVTTGERARILSVIRGRDDPPAAPTPTPAPGPCWIRTREAAHRLACSPRTIARLAQSGILTRRRLPGRRHGSGFLVADVERIILGEVGAK